MCTSFFIYFLFMYISLIHNLVASHLLLFLTPLCYVYESSPLLLPSRLQQLRLDVVSPKATNTFPPNAWLASRCPPNGTATNVVNILSPCFKGNNNIQNTRTLPNKTLNWRHILVNLIVSCLMCQDRPIHDIECGLVPYHINEGDGLGFREVVI